MSSAPLHPFTPGDPLLCRRCQISMVVHWLTSFRPGVGLKRRSTLEFLERSVHLDVLSLFPGAPAHVSPWLFPPGVRGGPSSLWPLPGASVFVRVTWFWYH